MILLKSYYIDTTSSLDFINIVHEVRGVVREAKAQEGVVTIVVPHPEAAIVTMETGSKMEEIKKGLQSFVDNGVLSCLLPRSTVIPLERGKLSTDPWQEIFLIDFSKTGKRREFRVQVFGEPEKGQDERGQ